MAPEAVPGVDFQQNGLIAEPADAKQAVDASGVPVKQDGQGRDNAQGQHPPVGHRLIYPPEQQRQQVKAVQPHNVPLLHHGKLAQPVAQGQQHGHQVIQPSVKPPVQEEGHGARRQGQLKGRQQMKKHIQIGLGHHRHQQVKGGGQVIAVQGHAGVPQELAEGVAQAVFPPKDILKIGQKVHILGVGIPQKNAVGAEGGHPQQGVDDQHHAQGREKCGQALPEQGRFSHKGISGQVASWDAAAPSWVWGLAHTPEIIYRGRPFISS